jgi:hypothetical protein
MNTTTVNSVSDLNQLVAVAKEVWNTGAAIFYTQQKRF